MTSEGTLRRAGLALLGALLLAACSSEVEAPSAQSQAAAAAPAPRPVRVVVAESGVLQAERSAPLSIEAARESSVAAGTSGRVAALLARPGQAVAAGETVVVLDDSGLRAQVRDAELALESARINLQSAERASGGNRENARLQLEAAEANAAIARRQVEEGRALLRAGGIAASELQRLEAQLSQAESTLAQAREALARSQRLSDEDLALLRLQVAQAENALAQAREAHDEARVKAPFAGEIAELYVEVGEFLGAGSPAFRLLAAGPQVATFNVPSLDAQRLLERGAVTVFQGGRELEARLVRSALQQGQRLTTLTAQLPEDAPRLPHGSVTELRYRVDLAEGLLLPSGAVAAEDGQTVAYVVEGGRARRRAVEVLAESAGTAAVRGLEPGALVISPRPIDLREGAEVSAIDD